jgi:acetyltransferase EpsM
MLYIYGTGGHAKVVYDALSKWEQSSAWITFLNDAPIEAVFMGRPVKKPEEIKPRSDGLVIGIGDNLSRARIYRELSERGVFAFPEVIHTSATSPVLPSLWNYSGSHFLANSFIAPSASVGKFCIINTAATVDHDCVLGDFVHIAPGVHLCGNVHVGDNTLVGVGSVAIPGVRIGKNCIIGAGSVVVNDIPDGVVAFGNPCRVVKDNHV